jgi:hypothetical protein
MSEELTPKLGPNAADAPAAPVEDAKVFGYDVASQARVGSNPNKPNPNSPLAAG